MRRVDHTRILRARVRPDRLHERARWFGAFGRHARHECRRPPRRVHARIAEPRRVAEPARRTRLRTGHSESRVPEALAPPGSSPSWKMRVGFSKTTAPAGTFVVT